MLILVGGYAGSGKSEFGSFLSNITGWTLLDKDLLTRPLAEGLLTDQFYGDISAASPHDAWAVGQEFATAKHPHSVALHWNGHKWSAVPAPGDITTVVDIAPDDAWALSVE